jgi:hypothetical protein
VVSCDRPIVTGVPRQGREPENYRSPVSSEPPAPSIFDRRSAPRDPREPTAPKQTAEPIEAEWCRVRVTVELPTEGNPGRIEEGLYRVTNGTVEVKDMSGRTLGVQEFGSNDPEVVARQIMRKKRPMCVLFSNPISASVNALRLTEGAR